MPTKFQLITELYDQTVQSVTGSYQSWTGFLRAACYNYKCPFDDQILIYAQRPDATAVLEMERWNRQFGRWVNRGAKSIAVFGDDGQNCLKLYFDVSDTHASRFARPLPIWTMHPAFEPEVIETLEATFGNLSEKGNLADAVRSACHNAVADNFTDYLQDLRDCREDSLLEELDDLNLEAFYRDALEVSVAYMLMTRLGLRADDHITADEFAHVYEFNTPPTINALGIATSDIAEMGLREISRTVMQAQRDQFFANRTRIGYDGRTEQHETPHERSEQYGGHLQDTERLSGAEFDDAQRTGGASGQVRRAAESVPEEAPQSALHQPQDQRQADGASGRDRADRAEDGGADRGADGESRGRDGGTESDRSPALDGPDEQSPAQRGGAGAQRPDLQLTTKEPTEAGSDELPASAVIDAAQPTIKELFEQYEQTVAAALVKDTAFVNACRNSDHENAIMEGADAIRRIVNESGDLQLAKLYFDMPAFHNRLHQELLEETYPKLVNAADHSPFKPYQVAAYHHIENGFDDKLDYQTLEEAETAAQGYVAGTMEEDGFAYDGAAVYDAETRQCLRVYGDYPDEKAQEQAAAFALEHDAVTPNGTELPAFLDMHLIEANLLDDGGRKHKRQEIFEYFQAHENLAERTEFLKNSYNDIWVEVLTDGVRTGYHAEKDGLLMWEGSYLSRTSESVFSWSVITEMTEGLIERGEYKIKLGLQNAPIVAEQLALFDMGGDAPVYEAPPDAPSGILAPARTVPQEVIDQALYTAGNEPGSAERIAVFYMREHSEQENIAFLRREFGTENGRGIEYEGRKYAMWFLEDGIHLAQGDSTEGTFDAYLYQLVESKQKFISQIMTSKSPVRSAEDVDEQALSYAEIKALASGNPMIKEKMDLDIEVSKLKLLKANHLSQKYALEDAISKGFPKQIAETQARIAGYGADIATVKENTHPNGDGFSPLTLAGVTYADKKEAGAALLTMCQTMLSPEATQIGSYRGLTLELAFDTFAREYRLTMIGQLRHTVTLGTDVFGNLQRMDNALEGLPIKEQTCREQLSNLQTQLETAKTEVQKPFPREAELNTKTARLEELNSLLNLDHKEPEIVDAEPDEDQRPPERRRPQLER